MDQSPNPLEVFGIRQWLEKQAPGKRLTSQWSGRLRATRSGAAHRRVRHHIQAPCGRYFYSLRYFR